MKIIEGAGCWLLVDNAGDVITQRSSREELEQHWDRLSAQPKPGDELRGGTRSVRPPPYPIEGRGVGLRGYEKGGDDQHAAVVKSADSKRMWSGRGSGARRRETETIPRRRHDRWGD